jgi:hypothetical protein
VHSFHAPSGLSYRHNGDFSGDIKLPEVPGWIEEGAAIPFEDIKALYYRYLEADMDRPQRLTSIHVPIMGDDVMTEAMNKSIQLIQSGIGDSVDDFLAHTAKIEAYLRGDKAEPKPSRQHSGGTTDDLRRRLLGDEKPISGPGSQEWSDRVTAEKAQLRSEGQLPVHPELDEALRARKAYEAEQLRLARAKDSGWHTGNPNNTGGEPGE